MSRKPAEDLIRSNVHEAARRRRVGAGVVRPAGAELTGLAPSGFRGLDDGGAAAAAALGVPGAESIRRDELVEALLSAELASVRGAR